VTSARGANARTAGTHAAARPPGERTLPSLWFGLLAAPVAWGIQLLLVYALAVWTCDNVGLAGLHVVSLLCFVLVLAGARAAWKNLHTLSGNADASPATRRVLALLGVMASSLFAVVVLGSWLGVFLLSPCPS